MHYKPSDLFQFLPSLPGCSKGGITLPTWNLLCTLVRRERSGSIVLHKRLWLSLASLCLTRSSISVWIGIWLGQYAALTWQGKMKSYVMVNERKDWEGGLFLKRGVYKLVQENSNCHLSQKQRNKVTYLCLKYWNDSSFVKEINQELPHMKIISIDG